MASPLRSQIKVGSGYRWRLWALMLAFGGVFGLIGYRLYQVQIVQHDQWLDIVRQRRTTAIILPPHRGSILDREGHPLASSTVLDTLYFHKAPFKEKAESIEEDAKLDEKAKAKELAKLQESEWEITRVVAEAIEEPRLKLIDRLKDAPTALEEKISSDQSEKIQDVLDEGFEGLKRRRIQAPSGVIAFKREAKRLYPKASLAAPLLGFCTTDLKQNENDGAAGLEAAYDEELRGKEVLARLRVNQWGRIIEPVSREMELASYGNSLRLTIDSEIQYFAETALARRIEELKAVGGALVAMDPRTGDLLAVASYPSFVPDDPRTRTKDAMFNRAVQQVLEPGSVMKIFTYATALENGLVTPEETIDCEGRPYCFREGRVERTIADFHPMGVVSALEAFADSSNIAAVKVGLRIDAKTFYNKLVDLNLIERAGLGLPGETTGLLRSLDRWSFLTRTSIPFGYELSVNAVQLAACASAIANGGEKMAPRLVRESIAPTGEVVETFKPRSQGVMFSPKTCQTMVMMMEAVVTEGTGKDAAIEGYRVAGKTGTSRKPKKDGEDNKYIGSFVGFLPASNPQLLIYCWIDEPSPANGDYTGGRAAAPVFRQVAEQAIRILGIPPAKAGDAPAAPVFASQDIAMEGDPGDSVDDPEEELPRENSDEARPADSRPPRPEPAEGRAGDSTALAKSRPDQQGGMPDLTGMSMREARSTLDAFRGAPDGAAIKASFYGEGYVFDQNPAPHTPVEAGEECSIYFAPHVEGEEGESPDEEASVASAADH